MIPPFDEDGNLPPGIHPATWVEIVDRYATNEVRTALLQGLSAALSSLKRAGCTMAYLDGSFVTTKKEPGDFDACWEARDVDPDLLDPELLDFSDARDAQKRRYGGELFPSSLAADPAGTAFLEFFQNDRHTGLPKGIIAINLAEFE